VLDTPSRADYARGREPRDRLYYRAVSPDEPMAIGYLSQSEKYRPEVIETLLVGESPPPNGKSYFYLPTTLRNNVPIVENRSLPATIFYHYFQRLPTNEKEYGDLLMKLKQRRVFLVDLVDEPIRVRGSSEGIERIIEAIPKLRAKLARRNIDISDERVVFLLARGNYRKWIREAFPKSSLVPWIDFRMGRWPRPAGGRQELPKST
jgi:hypothetical protein